MRGDSQGARALAVSEHVRSMLEDERLQFALNQILRPPGMPPMTRGWTEGHEAALQHLSALVCRGPTLGPFGGGVSTRAPGQGASGLASSQSRLLHRASAPAPSRDGGDPSGVLPSYSPLARPWDE
jgi:hypothetical protein